jgi:hypothetical protein
METEATVIFVIASFGLAVTLLLTRERIPQAMRRSVALLSIFLVLFAFFLIVYSFFRIGT